MLDDDVIERLKKNFEHVDALGGIAEVRLYDPLSSWECYILAIDPENEEFAAVMMCDGGRLWFEEVSLHDLLLKHNLDGELMEIDHDFIPCSVLELHKTLVKRNPL